MLWLVLFLASTVGAILLGKRAMKRLNDFLEAHPNGLQSASDADDHKKWSKQKAGQALLILLLALTAIISLIGVTATYGGIGLIPIAIATALVNQGARQFTEKERDFEQLQKDYKAQSQKTS